MVQYLLTLCVVQVPRHRRKIRLIEGNAKCRHLKKLMRANPLPGQVGGGGWALEIEMFLGPVKWHQAVRRVPFGAQKDTVMAVFCREFEKVL
jgi:hypothetical protein